jgi:pteridine reductase
MKPTGSALITGGAKRIGRDIALFLASQGYKIAIHYGKSLSHAKDTAAQIRGAGGTCELFGCDLQNSTQTVALVYKVLRKFPDLNLLVNNAAIFEKSSLHSDQGKSFDRHMNINLRAPYLLICQFAQKCGKGQVINILDSRITRNDVSCVAYSISKKALASLTELAALELAPNIRVNAIAPGLILPPPGQNEGYLNRLAKHVPLKSKGTVADILQTVKYLLEQKNVTGQILFADGGQHLTR